MNADDPMKRYRECRDRVGEMSQMLSHGLPDEDIWRSLAASARQIERRAAEQYKLAEINDAREKLNAYLAREGGA